MPSIRTAAFGLVESVLRWQLQLMDEGLRTAEREGDWRRLAASLWRSGRTIEARRLLEQATRAGESEAWEALDEWFPLDQEAHQLIELLESHRGLTPYRETYWAVGDGDPRLDRVLRSQDLPVREDWLDLSLLDRLRATIPDVGAQVLARTRLTSDEALDLFRELVLTAGDSSVVALSLTWLLGTSADDRGRQALRSLVERAGDSLLGMEARLALGPVADLPPPPCLGNGLPLRPDWTLHRSPTRWRDDLTCCWNRRGLPVDSMLSQGFEMPETPWVMLFDIDHFKSLNDVCGFMVGDELLAAVARALQDQLGDRVIRYAGDEFLVPWEGDDALEAARAAGTAVRQLPPVQGHEEHPRLTISGAVTPGGSDPQAILGRLDEGMMEAKRLGRDQIREV